MLWTSPRTVAPPPCLPLDIKDLLKDARIFDEGFLAKDKLLEGELLKGELLKGGFLK
jgi:hypothetical protein